LVGLAPGSSKAEPGRNLLRRCLSLAGLHRPLPSAAVRESRGA